MFAAIDIGSNTILLLIAQWNRGKLLTIAEKQEIPRLGRNIDQTGKLSPDSIEEASNIVCRFKHFVQKEFSDEVPIVVTGTSAVREASNHEELTQVIRNKCGLNLKVITGEQEARLTYQGALSTVDFADTDDLLIVDVGGGSTEIIHGNNQKIVKLQSFRMGSVRNTENYLQNDKPWKEQIADCRKKIYEQLGKTTFNIPRNAQLIAVEGTATTLACIANEQISNYDPDQINGSVLKADKLREIVRWLESRSPKQLLELYPEVMKGRADVFLGGVLILEAVIHHFSMNSLVISAGGIRHGSIIRYLKSGKGAKS